LSAEPALAASLDVEPYRGQMEYFGDELTKLDALLALRALEAKAGTAADEVGKQIAVVERWQQTIDRRLESSRLVGTLPPLPCLRRRLGMSPFEQEAVLVCLAPELDLKYAAAYRELAGGGHAGGPTVALVLDLLCGSWAERWHARALLDAGASLLRWRFLERTSESHGSGLADPLRIDPGTAQFLCGTGRPDPRLVDVAQLEPAGAPADPDDGAMAPAWAAVARFVGAYTRSSRHPERAMALHLASDGRGAALDGVRRVSADLGCPLLRVDAAALDRREGDLSLLVTLALRDGFFWRAPLLLQGLDGLPADRSATLVARVMRAAERFRWLVLLDGGAPPPASARKGSIWHGVDIPPTDHIERARQWRRALAPWAGADAEGWSAQLASRFRFEPEQISETAEILALQSAESDSPLTLADCFRSCRAQAAPRLGEIGRIFGPRYGWSDLVLADRQRAQLEAICQCVRHHEAVFGRWGFGRTIHHGRAVSALLVGPSGTGKTMAVEIIASALGLDVCKVDLSGVVSKYIGETEQRLSVVFREAWTANAVLFFDEADALFGKRTEITDARDRYANIETSYLLQKIEEYEGIVVLASNLRDNMDEAFTRRLRFIVEFPSPDEAARLQIWKRHLPPAAPLDDGVDLPRLAKRFAVSGGSIRNMALRGALLAAEHGTAIRMDDLVNAAREEFEKIGKSWVLP